MTGRTILRVASIIAAGFLISIGAPANAVPSDNTAQAGEVGKPLKLTKSDKPRAKAASRTRKPKVAARRSAKASVKTVEKDRKPEVALPAAVADAKAEMPQADARGVAEVKPAAAEVTPLEVTASEQMNELDRAASAMPDEGQPRAIKTELVKDDRPQAAMPVIVAENAQGNGQGLPQITTPDRASAASVTAASGDAWAQSSLIGKIFIAFGGMLTLASAARMLIA